MNPAVNACIIVAAGVITFCVLLWALDQYTGYGESEVGSVAFALLVVVAFVTAGILGFMQTRDT